jgi:DNA-binding MarR family transcriptional regulator/N-acetylglutamate synthase-like GNAT family acetyltransferase
MAQTDFDRRVEAVRRFNRFYTRQIGVLSRGYLDSPFSLTQVRVLYELAHREKTTATELAADLGLDEGYLSRVLAGFHARGLLGRRTAERDGRQSVLWLTPQGRRVIGPLETRARRQIAAILKPLGADEQTRLVSAMDAIEGLLGRHDAPPAPYVLRSHRPGDMGWVVHRHGALYAQEYGWNEEFEALVAGIVSKFIEHLDPNRERCWVAERDGRILGCVFLVKKSQTVAKLRLLLVEPEARGLGLGTRLVDECICFARQAGYRKMTLWTNSVLDAARRIYERAGFRMVHKEAHQSFGHALTSETWERAL